MKKWLVFGIFMFGVSRVHATVPAQMISGFETGDVQEMASSIGTFAVITTVTHSGIYALEVNPSTGSTGAVKFCSLTTGGGAVVTNPTLNAFFRSYVDFNAVPSSNDEEFEAVMDTNSVYKLSVRVNSARHLVVYDSSTIAIATGTTTLPASFTRVEINVATSTTTGPWQVNINGVLESSGIANVGAQQTGGLWLGRQVNRSSQAIDFIYDDLFYSSTTFPGPGICNVLVAVSTTTNALWVEGAGLNIAVATCCTQIPNDGDTSYMRNVDIGDSSDFNIQSSSNLPLITGSTVNAVSLVVIDKRDAGAATFQPEIISNGTTKRNTGPSTAVASYQAHILMSSSDPSDGSSWSPTRLSNLQIGAISGSIAATRVTSLYLMVDYQPGLVPPTKTVIYNSKIYNEIIR